MQENQNKILNKLSAFVFGIIFLSVIILLGLTFFNPEPKVNSSEKLINQPLSKTWQAIYDKKFYLVSKKEITKYAIYDSIRPRWVEYYTPSDSIENITSSLEPLEKITYATINRKHQQINCFSYRLYAIDSHHTKVKIYELSRYFNVWGSIYFQLFKPNTVLDYEFVKLNNTFSTIDSLTKN
ncbi:MAG: hypothetical protein JNL75_12520 [Chitinophagales bacterium]|nr:hypothetical protein [Chitinophagales bacterium]